MKREIQDSTTTRRCTVVRRGKMWLSSVAVLFLVFLASPAPGQSGASPGGSEFTQKPGQARIETKVLKDILQAGQSSFWVVLQEQADLKPARQMWNWQVRGAFVHEKLHAVASRTQPGLQRVLQNRGANYKPVWIVNAIHVTGDQATLDEVARHPEVREIIVARTYSIPRPMGARPQPAIGGFEWNIDRVNAPRVWADYGKRGEGIVICSIDSGVQFDHPALVKQYRGNLGEARSTTTITGLTLLRFAGRHP